MDKIIIIGNGIAGITAARHIRKLSDHDITVISAESKYFFSRTALMYVYMGHMKFKHIQPYEDWFWKKNNINLVHDYVEKVVPEQKCLQLRTGETLPYDQLIIACGSVYNTFGWSGQELQGVTGMVSLQDLEKIERYSEDTEQAVIVGGGLIGIELAEMLRSRNKKVTFLIREKYFWDNVLPDPEAQMVMRHLKEHHVEVRPQTELGEIIGDENGRVKAVKTREGEQMECQMVGLTAGVRPNIGFLEGSGIETEKGILVDEYFRTNKEDIYAIGDCAQLRQPPTGRRALEAVWYTGRMQGENVAQTLCGNPVTYRPGPWFNSAKFMDIEYQVYGQISNKPQEDEAHFYWEHPEEHKSLRIAFDKRQKHVLGFNLMGIRYRHEVCDRWIQQKKSVREVMAQLIKANFDPEFYKKYEADIVTKFNQKYPEMQVKLIREKNFLQRIFS